MTELEESVERVPLGSLKRYLNATGWRKYVEARGLEVFAFIEDKDIEIVLPISSRARDTMARLVDALTTLTALERRSVHEVVADIRAVNYDLLLSRLPEAAIRHDTIRLGAAEEFIKHMPKMLAAVAHGELHVGPYFERVSSTATAYASGCRFGHTFRGSFGFTVESQVGPQTLAPGEIAAAPPLGRRAILRLARGLDIIKSAIDDDAPAKIVSSYNKGLNANACEELAAIVEVPQIGEVTFDIVFSPEWGVPADVAKRHSTKIGQLQALDVIKEAAKGLRAVNYEKRRIITGKIRTLHSMEDTPADLFTISGLQNIIVEWESDDFGKRLVRVSLGPEDYLQAMEAHKAGRSISVFGELEARPWRLENSRDFKVI